MSKPKFLACAVLAVFGLATAATVASAQCSSCDTAGSQFSYPATGHGGLLGRSQIGSELRSQFEQQRAINQRIAARNLAWPRPFTCVSRQLYHNMFNAMVNAGWEDQCILTDVHFEEDTGELTRYGVQQIGGMMMNMPQGRRVVFVQQGADQEKTSDRVQRIRDVISTYYPQRGGIVQVSARTPATQSGLRAENISNLAGESTPAPIIPVASGTSGIGGSGN